MKKNKLKLIRPSIVILLTLSVFLFSSCEDDEVAQVRLKTFTLSVSNLELDLEEVKSIVVLPTPKNTTDDVVWISSNDAVAEVQFSKNGLVTGVKGVSVGSAILTAKSGSTEKKVRVDVLKKIKGIKLDIVGGVPEVNVPNVRYNIVFNPTDATNKNVIWVSSKPSVATVTTNGLVTAVAPGVAKISVTTLEGAKTASVDATVIGSPALLRFQYCDVSGSKLYNVVSVKTTGGSSNLDYTGDQPENNYKLITDQTLIIAKGETFNLAVKNGNGWSRTLVWIDWNGDLDFDDDSEYIGAFSPEKLYSGDPGVTYNKDITVPESAVVGKAIIRILSGDAWTYEDAAIPSSPCGTLITSTIKDFIIEIK